MADESTGVLNFYQNDTTVFQITVVASKPKLAVMLGSEIIKVGGLSVGSWNKILIQLKYEPTFTLLRLKAYLEGVLINQVDMVAGVLPFLNTNVYLSQHGLRPMHGKIRDLEFSKSN